MSARWPKLRKAGHAGARNTPFAGEGPSSKTEQETQKPGGQFARPVGVTKEMA